MKIKIGDTVKIKNQSGLIFGALKVINIVDFSAVCSYYELDKNQYGSERPAVMVPTEGIFPLEDLILIVEA